MTRSRTALGLYLSALVCACGGDDEAPRPPSIASKLTTGLMFPQGMVIEAPFPETTDPSARLLPLGPAVVVAPEGSGLMALRVQDPEEREIEATLIQFSDVDRYVRVPPEEGGGSNIVENGFTAADDLCEGLCDAVFTVTVTEAIEFADGAISEISTRQIVVDCREHGDPAACDEFDPSFESDRLLCGDVIVGEIVWTGDPVLDAHFEAVRMLADAATVAADTVDEVREEIAGALEIDSSSSAAAVAAALTDAIEMQTEDGLSLLLAEQGCALTLGHVTHMLRACDPEAPDAITLGCAGVCEPIGGAEGCASAASSGCRGLVDGESCAGQCDGSCELTLDEPAECAGTCVGTCDGECPDGAEDCAGPCTGLCTGTCHVLSSDSCDGPCTGLCDAVAEGAPACAAPLDPYCAPALDETIDCRGDCFGAGPVDVGGGPCAPSALAVARALPRCEPPLVQLSFAFQPGVSASAQSDFAELVQAANAPFAELFGVLARLDLLVAANDELLAAAEGEIPEYLESLSGDAEDSGLACAERRLPELAEWLAAETPVLEQLRADAMLLAGTLSAVP